MSATDDPLVGQVDELPPEHPDERAVLGWFWHVYDVLALAHRELKPPPFARPAEPVDDETAAVK